MNNLKNIFKKNQVIIAALAIMIIAAGYLNFTRDKIGDDESTSGVETNAQIPDEELDIASSEDDASVQEDANSDTNNSEVGEAVLANNSIGSDFFVSNKLKREQTRAKNEETLNEIINNANVSDEQKQDAIDQMVELTDIQEKESVTETLLEAKGFPESLVTINDGKVEVVVNANDLTEQEIAQIEDVVKRKTGIAAKNIVISPVSVSDTAAAESETGSDSEDVNIEGADSASEDASSNAAIEEENSNAKATATPEASATATAESE